MKYKISESWVRQDGRMYVIDFVDIRDGIVKYPADKRFCSKKSAKKFMDKFVSDEDSEPQLTMTQETNRTKTSLRNGFAYEAVLEEKT